MMLCAFLHVGSVHCVTLLNKCQQTYMCSKYVKQQWWYVSSFFRWCLWCGPEYEGRTGEEVMGREASASAATERKNAR